MSINGSLKNIECPNTDDNVFVLRYPLLNNSIKIGTKLLVKQNQVAVIVDEGEVCDVLPEGIHTLTVNTLPRLAAKKHWDRRFNASFRCDIYFVSLTLFDNLKWGMINSLIIRDNDFGSVAIKCFGNCAFKVVDARVFMKELFGKITSFNDDDISLYIKTLITTGITDMLLEKRLSALDFVTNYDKFEMEDFQIVREKFALCGLFLQRLNIENITIPEEIEKLINIKIEENINNYAPQNTKNNLPVNHPINAGTIHTAEMKKIFNFTHDFTITCVKCGATIAKNFKFCPQCGAENKEIAKECPQCHNIVAFKANFCPDCGTKLFDKNQVVLCKHCGRIVADTDLYCPDCGKIL
jgi:membrane protease subunit (stomatin/prohibitin family)